MLRFYNTLSRSIEPFTPLTPPKVRFYACGPTVYNYAHIGNFRAYVFEDLVRRTLEGHGYQVHHIQNITDVDDKTIRGATAKGCSLEEYTAPYTAQFFHDLQQLAILPAHHYPRATDHIDAMQTMIQTLIDRKHATVMPSGDVYFRVDSFPRYGQLVALEPAQGDVQIDDEYIGGSADFALWKSHKLERDGTIFWHSPWGKGRPGWHIECSAMARAHLGDTLDLHAGGIDNKFPHHENEIAQSECCTQCTFVQVWMHCAHLLLEGQKMSKSLGNCYTLVDLVDKGYDPRAVRYLLNSAHYRTPLNFTWKGLEDATKILERWQLAWERTAAYQPTTMHHKQQENITAIKEALAFDLNSAVAYAKAQEGLKTFLQKTTVDGSDACWLLAVEQLLGGLRPQKTQPLPPAIAKLVEARDAARQRKAWTESDALRAQLEAAGWSVKDGKDGTTVTKNPPKRPAAR